MTGRSVRTERDADGVVTITFDEPGRPVNTIGPAFMDEWAEVTSRLREERAAISGVIVTSAKETFLGGADLNAILAMTPDGARAFAAMGDRFKTGLRVLETLGCPVVAALGGAALGGGYEVAMACHHRLAVRGSRATFGLPEVTLGLLPGAGIVRSIRLFGVVEALTTLLLSGMPYSADAAAERGLVSALVDTPADLLPAARTWIHANGDASQPWDRSGFMIPGAVRPEAPRDQFVAALPAALRAQVEHGPLFAPKVIFDAALEIARLGFEDGVRVETRAFERVLCSQQAKNLTQAFFFDTQQLAKGATRPAGEPRWQATRVAVLGAGMMGAGIAWQAARSGLDVILKDVDVATAERGKGHSERLAAQAVQAGRMTRSAADALLARIRPTGDVADLTACDVVVEAVFEDTALKQRVLGETEPRVAFDALLASNTSQIPIATLAASVSRPQDFIGLHFFSPVERMPLVEVVVAPATSARTLARAFDFVQQLRFTPLVVKDSRGFFTTRVILQFIGEAFALVLDGVPPETVERAATSAGYPVGALQLADELDLRTARKVLKDAAGHPMADHPGFALIDVMLDDADRPGRLAGKGFYEYVDGRRAGLWPGLAVRIPRSAKEIPMIDLQERMMFRQAIDAVACFDEGVIDSHATANLASIRGIGFPAWTGGVVQFVDQYEGGTRGFVARCRELADAYGARFTPPPSLIALAERGARFRP